MSEDGSNPERGAARLTVGVPCVVAAALLLIGQLIPGQGLCQARGYAPASADLYGVAVIALPALAVVALLMFGAWRGWRLKTLALKALTSVALSGLLSVLVFIWVLGEEGCFK
jgi:phosphatidylserine synthase